MFMSFSNGKATIDHDKIMIGGVAATRLSREEVFAHCESLNVAGISPAMGRGTLLEAYARHLAMWASNEERR